MRCAGPAATPTWNRWRGGSASQPGASSEPAIVSVTQSAGGSAGGPRATVAKIGTLERLVIADFGAQGPYSWRLTFTATARWTSALNALPSTSSPS